MRRWLFADHAHRWDLLVSRRAGIVVVALAVARCLDPTEIVVDVSTDVPCGSFGGVEVRAGAPGDLDAGKVSSMTACAADGNVGSVVVLPHDLSAVAGIEVRIGVNADVGLCDTDPSSCIVARRALHYAIHEPLDLPIELDESCLGVVCDPASTCYRGSCVDAGAPCDGGSCTLPDMCTPAGPVMIAATTTAATPRIARTHDGYLLAWEPGLGTLHGKVVDQAGGELSKEVQLATEGTNLFGPVGSDGTDFAVTYADATSLHVALVARDGGVSPLIPVQGPNLPLQGLLRDSPHKRYLMAAEGATGQIFAFGDPDGGLKSVVNPPPFDGGVNVILGQSTATELLLGFAQGVAGCALYRCSEDPSGNYNCTPVALPAAPGCVALRAAASVMHVFAMVNGPGLGSPFKFSFDGMSVMFPAVTAVDAPTAFMVLPTENGGAFRVIWRAGMLQTARYPDALSAVPLTTGPTSAPTGLQAFDAVVDGPGTRGYAVVYWESAGGSNGNVMFLHACN